jgi:methionine-R-sulfoxide reductase
MTKKQADSANICHIEPTEELRMRLGPERFAVLVENGTEPPFRNAYWNKHEEGVYVDAVDGTPLFSSRSKYDSGTGWPSFWDPIDPKDLVLIEDRTLGLLRTEVRAKKSGGHLGHLFDDGHEPSGKRYCMNSASLRFVSVAELECEGLERLLPLFEAR